MTLDRDPEGPGEEETPYDGRDLPPRTVPASASGSSAPEIVPAPRAPEMLVPLIVACALFMQLLDSTIITTALPAMAASLHQDPIRLNITITAYLLVQTIFIPASGWLADRYGSRLVFIAAITLFALASAGCGFSHSLGSLVLWRVIQGIGGALMVPVGRLIMLRGVSKPNLLRAMNYLVVPAALGPLVGPPLGGLIVTYASWPWIFFINLPVGIAGIALAYLFFPNTRESAIGSFDFRGFLLTGVALGALTFAFETLGRGAVPLGVEIVLIVIGTLAGGLYILHAARAANPIIDLKLLRIASFKAGTIYALPFRIAVGTQPFLFPLLFQIGFGMTPIASAMLILANASGLILNRLFSTRTVRAMGFRAVLILSGTLSGVFIAATALFRPSTPHIVIFLTMLVGGIFRSLQFTAMNGLCFAEMPSPLMSSATSFTTLLQQMTTAIGVTLAALMLHLTLALRGGATLQWQDFGPAFVLAGLFTLTTIPAMLRLPADAGAEVSGHRPRIAKKPVDGSGERAGGDR